MGVRLQAKIPHQNFNIQPQQIATLSSKIWFHRCLSWCHHMIASIKHFIDSLPGFLHGNSIPFVNGAMVECWMLTGVNENFDGEVCLLNRTPLAHDFLHPLWCWQSYDELAVTWHQTLDTTVHDTPHPQDHGHECLSAWVPECLTECHVPAAARADVRQNLLLIILFCRATKGSVLILPYCDRSDHESKTENSQQSEMTVEKNQNVGTTITGGYFSDVIGCSWIDSSGSEDKVRSMSAEIFLTSCDRWESDASPLQPPSRQAANPANPPIHQSTKPTIRGGLVRWRQWRERISDCVWSLVIVYIQHNEFGAGAYFSSFPFTWIGQSTVLIMLKSWLEEWCDGIRDRRLSGKVRKCILKDSV